MNAIVKEEVNHAEQNAAAWYGTIAELVAALEVDYDRLDELRSERQNLAETLSDMQDDTSCFSHEEISEAKKALADWDAENGEELRELTTAATIEGDLQIDADTVRERIQEGPLSVEVRDDWRSASDDSGDPVEFKILLSTGGPALRIMGELGEHNEPTRAYLQYQDWGTSWIDYFPGSGSGEVLLTYCQQFYFGE